MIVRAGAVRTASEAGERRTSGSAPLPVPGADVASDTAHSIQRLPTGMTSVFESGLHASHGSERLRDPDVRHQVHEALGDRFLAHFGGLDRGADVTGKLRFGAAHCRQGGHVEHLAVAELEAVTLVRAAEHCADHPVGRARGIFVQLLLPGRGTFRGLGLCDELVALGHAQFHDILLDRTKTTRIRLAHASRAERHRVSARRPSSDDTATETQVQFRHRSGSLVCGDAGLPPGPNPSRAFSIRSTRSIGSIRTQTSVRSTDSTGPWLESLRNEEAHPLRTELRTCRPPSRYRAQNLPRTASRSAWASPFCATSSNVFPSAGSEVSEVRSAWAIWTRRRRPRPPRGASRQRTAPSPSISAGSR